MKLTVLDADPISMQEAIEQLRGIARNSKIEFFMVESPCNHYLPTPPQGFTAYRSNKRRVFIHESLETLDWLGHLDELLKNGGAKQFELCPATC